MRLFSLFTFLIFSFFSFSQNIKVTKIKSEELTFSVENFNTDELSLEYGKTENLELGTVKGLVLSHLTPSTFYFVKAISNNVETKIKLFATASSTASPTNIKVYFNQGVDNLASNIADALYLPDFEDTIVAYIDRTQNTLDICNYNTGSINIVNAINAAETRGVIVRYIAADNTGTNNDELNNISATIPFLQRPDDGEVMHNKFLIMDIADATLAKVLTGSVNHTLNSCHQDFNNMVILEDQTIALAYKTEFEEMWGSTTNTPNSINAKFGDDKADNTPHNFNIGGIPVELYFSPSDNVSSHIETAILSADYDMQFAMLTFIHNDLGAAVETIHNAGVLCKGIVENTWYFGSEYNDLVNAGVDMHSHFSVPHTLHHKYGIVDANSITSDPLVITGSHNWTNSAEEDFDENTLIIHDATIANMYYEEFMARFTGNINGPLIVLDTTIYAQICDNENYTLPLGNSVNTSGVYCDTLTSINSYDSIVETILTVYPSYYVINSISICENDSFVLPLGEIVFNSGTYYDTLQTIFSCDSVIQTNLLVNNNIIIPLVDAYTCSGIAYVLPWGETAYTSGTYYDTIQSLNDCDTIFEKHLFFIENSSSEIFDTINSNQIYTLPSGQLVSSQGIYIDTILNSQFCDSIITVNLFITKDVTIENIADFKYLIYPNPASKSFYIELSENSNISKIVILNTLGQIVYSTDMVLKKNIISTPLWSKGIYYISINGFMVEKIMIK